MDSRFPVVENPTQVFGLQQVATSFKLGNLRTKNLICKSNKRVNQEHSSSGKLSVVLIYLLLDRIMCLPDVFARMLSDEMN